MSPLKLKRGGKTSPSPGAMPMVTYAVATCAGVASSVVAVVAEFVGAVAVVGVGTATTLTAARRLRFGHRPRHPPCRRLLIARAEV